MILNEITAKKLKIVFKENEKLKNYLMARAGRLIRCQFHQRSTYSFYVRGAQKRKRDSEVVNLFTLLGTKRKSCM